LPYTAHKGMGNLRSLLSILLLVGLLTTFGCGLAKKLPARMIGAVFEGLSASIFEQPDVQLVEQALPAYLLLIDGLLDSSPGDTRLLRTGAQAYSAYASAFVEEEETERLALLYGKAREYSLRLLAIEQKKVASALQGPGRDFNACLPALRNRDVPDLFLAASCLGGWITANPDSPEAIAEQVKVVELMTRILELDESYYYGGPHLFFGIYHGVKPKVLGGQPDTSRAHFERALEMSGEQFLLTRVLYAQYYARQVLNQELYESLLQQVLDAPVEQYAETRLMNEVARVKAVKLLDLVDDYF